MEGRKGGRRGEEMRRREVGSKGWRRDGEGSQKKVHIKTHAT